MERIVTIFGGSKCGEDSEEYTQARRLGQLLAEAGFTICTGGYLGVMEGASRGARERRGRALLRAASEFDNALGRLHRAARRRGHRHGTLARLEQAPDEGHRAAPRR